MEILGRPLQIETDAPGPVVAYDFDESSFSRRKARRWSDERLWVTLHRSAQSEAAKDIIRAELSRRDAWRSPAGWAVYASVAAIGVSLLSLIIALIN